MQLGIESSADNILKAITDQVPKVKCGWLYKVKRKTVIMTISYFIHISKCKENKSSVNTIK